MPLSEIGLLRQKPNRIKFLSEKNIAPQRDTEDTQCDHNDEDLHGRHHDDLGYGFEDGLEDVLLREFVRLEVLVLEAGQSSIPLLLNSPLIDAEPGNKPGGLEDVDHDQPHRAEDAEGLQGRQYLSKYVDFRIDPFIIV